MSGHYGCGEAREMQEVGRWNCLESRGTLELPGMEWHGHTGMESTVTGQWTGQPF